jgi:hypothetical protein
LLFDFDEMREREWDLLRLLDLDDLEYGEDVDEQ